MIKKFRRIIFFKLRIIIYILWKLHLDKFIAGFLKHIIISYNKEDIKKNKNTTAIFAMERGIFNYDIEALKFFPSNYILLVYPTLARSLMFDEAEWLHPKDILDQTVFYAKKDEYKKHYDRLSNIFLLTIKKIEKSTVLKIKFILTANLDYFQDYPWIKSIHDNDGKFIVLEKESIVYLYTDTTNISNRHHKYNFKYDGDYVLFYNYLGKETYLKTGSIKPEQAFVTGCPRVDNLIKISKNKTKDSDFILIASFMQPYYFATKVWDEIISSINKDEILRKKTIIKCKNHEEVSILQQKYPLIIAVSDSIENYLIKQPTIFIGYNSTTCYDALIAGIPVIIPYWGETEIKSDDGLVGMHTSDFHLIAKSKEDLIKILKDYIQGNTKKYMNAQTVWNNTKLKEFLEKRYSRVDGKNCQRFFEFIDKINDKN